MPASALSRPLAILLALAVLGAAGCGGKTRVTVTQEATGRPIAGAELWHEKKMLATTGTDGIARLRRPRDGAPVAVLAKDHAPGLILLGEDSEDRSIVLKPMWLDEFLKRPEMRAAAAAQRPPCPGCPPR